MTPWWASTCGSPANDGAEDIDGHGTHVAGSVLGDGTDSSGNIKGMAPEARLYFQSVGSYCANNPPGERNTLLGFLQTKLICLDLLLKMVHESIPIRGAIPAVLPLAATVSTPWDHYKQT